MLFISVKLRKIIRKGYNIKNYCKYRVKKRK